MNDLLTLRVSKIEIYNVEIPLHASFTVGSSGGKSKNAPAPDASQAKEKKGNKLSYYNEYKSYLSSRM